MHISEVLRSVEMMERVDGATVAATVINADRLIMKIITGRDSVNAEDIQRLSRVLKEYEEVYTSNQRPPDYAAKPAPSA